MKRPIKVGVYNLGSESVELVLREGNGANFDTRSSRDGQADMTVIEIGGDGSTDWGEILSRLTYEAMELMAMRMGCRFVSDPDYARDLCGYAFMMTHAQHSQLCGRVGYFLADCLPDLARAWKQWRKK